MEEESQDQTSTQKETMMFIELTGASNKEPIFVNSEHIIAIIEKDEATLVDTVRLSYLVRESREQVLQLHQGITLTGDDQYHKRFKSVQPSMLQPHPRISQEDIQQATNEIIKQLASAPAIQKPGVRRPAPPKPKPF